MLGDPVHPHGSQSWATAGEEGSHAADGSRGPASKFGPGRTRDVLAGRQASCACIAEYGALTECCSYQSAMQGAQAVAAPVGSPAGPRPPASATDWRTWHTEQDVPERRRLIAQMYVLSVPI